MFRRGVIKSIGAVSAAGLGAATASGAATAASEPNVSVTVTDERRDGDNIGIVDLQLTNEESQSVTLNPDVLIANDRIGNIGQEDITLAAGETKNVTVKFYIYEDPYSVNIDLYVGDEQVVLQEVPYIQFAN